MEMNHKSLLLEKIFPILTIQDGVIVSKRGELTLGWEVLLPPICSCTPERYEEMMESFAAAVRCLGAGFIVHRQDLYTKDRYKGEGGVGFLQESYERHFCGREHLCHRQHIYLTLALKDAPVRAASSSGIFGMSVPQGNLLAKDLATLEQSS